MRLIYFLILGICVSLAQMSCYTSKKAGKQLAHAYRVYPAQVADSTSRWFPIVIIDSLIEDTLLEADDSTQYYKDRLAALEAENDYEMGQMDTIYRDTCRSAKNTYATGHRIGYGEGYNTGLQDCIPDTLLRKRLIVMESTAKLFVEKSKTVKAVKETEKWKKRFYIALGVAIVLLILLLIGYLLNRRK